MKDRPLNILCISRFYKGVDFIRGAKENGHHVYLLTSKKLDDSPWPWDCIDDTFYMVEDEHGLWNDQHLIGGLAHKMRTIKFDLFVALDDFDVEHVAYFREYFRIPGMGETTARYFRDKLAMRIRAKEEGIPVPEFTSLFHDADINSFADRVAPPWLVKPRMQASAAGIKKIHSKEELWQHLDHLGGERHEYLVEKFAPGSVYHVDTLTSDGKILFSRVSQYIETPLEVSHGGGIFRSHTVEIGSEDDKELSKMNDKVMKAFGMQYSASHSEFIKCNEDGRYYFLETSSRVGGAHLAEMIEFASGINLWKEWVKIEVAAFRKAAYKLPPVKKDYTGIVVSLSRFKEPDTSSFDDKEIVWRLKKDFHIGFIVKAKTRDKVLELLEKYTERIRSEYHASLPPKNKLVGD